MNRFQSFIKRIGGEDKVLHFETCCLITMIVVLLNMNVLGLGIAAEKMIQKMAKVIVEERAIDSENFKEYRRLANGYRFNPQLPELSKEEEKKLSPIKDDNSYGEVTNQKDISPSLKVTVRLFCEDVRDLFKNMQHLWQE